MAVLSINKNMHLKIWGGEKQHFDVKFEFICTQVSPTD